MRSTNELIHSLNQILDAQHPVRAELLKEFQDEIWNDEIEQDTKLNEILSELAYDLDFYEPNEQWRKESPNYYSDDRLRDIIKSGITKIEEYVKTSH